MGKHLVTVFKPYAFSVGQKIRIEGGKRAGDWEVAGTGEQDVTLRCPVSHKEFAWVNFCYTVEEAAEQEWPQK